MNPFIRQQLYNGKRRIEHRLRPIQWAAQKWPMFSASNIHYDVAGRTRAMACGGIGAIHLLARHVGLPEAINRDLHLLKVHLPYHESDHVLNIAYNILAGGTCLEDLERLRNDEVYLDALGALRIPDPTTAGDFCRRFKSAEQVLGLMETINEVRLNVWNQQPAEFFEMALVDADGTIAATEGQCKEGMDIAYNGQWGYHPLVLSLANTKEPLYLINRSGSRPSHEHAAEYFDRSFGLFRRAGFKRILARGDTDFSQTTHLDRWDAAGDVGFIFGMDRHPGLLLQAEVLSRSAWTRLERPPRYEVETEPRRRPENVKERIVRQRNFQNLVSKWEDVAEFEYRPVACKKAYRIVALRKRLAVKRGQQTLWEEYRYYFFITNEWELSAMEVVLLANDRCDQENLIAQLKGPVRAMKMPTGDLVSNWAYMVMASLAWTLKAWVGLSLPVSAGPWADRHRQQKSRVVKMEFKSFLGALVSLPCQIVKTGRRIIYRLLSWNPWMGTLVRAAEAWRKPLRC